MTVDSLNQGWLFGEYVAGGEAPEFDERGLAPVTLPHTVVPLSWRNWAPAEWERVWLYRRRLGPGRPGHRTFVDFEGAMVTATVYVNGHRYADHVGGYLPWSQEITDELTGSDNVLAVVLDSRWTDVPPAGHPAGAAAVDYLQPGGIYRDVTLRTEPRVFLADVFAKPVNVLRADRRVDVRATIDAAGPATGTLTVTVADCRSTVAVAVGPGRTTVDLVVRALPEVELWAPGSPHLYDVDTTLTLADGTTSGRRDRIGFREARFTEHGFLLNGEPHRIVGLNRHQSYPYVGFAMPARVQRRDAEILARELNCTMVRCSHYPQSRHFLDACDELGLLVWEEPPGWQYVGDRAWQDIAVADVRDMILRDRNRPSVILWGIRLNETAHHPEFYRRTQQVADELDGSRQTTGAVVSQDTDGWAADVFAFDDYRTDPAGNATLLPPVPGVPYLVSEAVGALDGPPYYRWTDSDDVLATQLVMHATVHDIAASDDRYAGLLGWAGFDYASLNGRVHQHVKWPGVVDTFRVPKFGAAFYQSQVDPAVRPVIEPGFRWDFGPGSPRTGPGPGAIVATNCDRLELYVDDRHVGTALPDRARFPHLRHPPAVADLTVPAGGLPELRIDGYVGENLVAGRRFTADPATDRLLLAADDPAIAADGSDTTRVLFRAVDAHGNQRPHVTGDVRLTVTGPGVLVGDNPFEFGDSGGVGAVWLRSRPNEPGRIRVTAAHATLGSATVDVVAE
ncbi:MAG TPA: glycoside hydrolase family 2 TIM barrel-domain containing protein [Pseudonocardiaceae bacterium]